MSAQIFEVGQIVDVLPDSAGCNYAECYGWTVVGPTRHAYAVVVREPRYGTTIHININRLAVAS